MNASNIKYHVVVYTIDPARQAVSRWWIGSSTFIYDELFDCYCMLLSCHIMVIGIRADAITTLI